LIVSLTPWYGNSTYSPPRSFCSASNGLAGFVCHLTGTCLSSALSTYLKFQPTYCFSSENTCRFSYPSASSITPPRSVSSVRHPMTLMSADLRPVATCHFVNAHAKAHIQVHKYFMQISLRLIIRTKSPKERRLTVFVILSQTYSNAQSRSVWFRPYLFSLIEFPRSSMYTVASLPAMFAICRCECATSGHCTSAVLMRKNVIRLQSY
jgi:hypothetical protein